MRATRLSVAAAFHSPQVAGAEPAFRGALEATEFHPAGAPVYANTTAAPYPDDAGKTRDLLAGQLARPVEWVAEIENLFRSGVRTFLEVGPGARLTGHGRRHPERPGARSAGAGRLERPAFRRLRSGLLSGLPGGAGLRRRSWAGTTAARRRVRRPTASRRCSCRSAAPTTSSRSRPVRRLPCEAIPLAGRRPADALAPVAAVGRRPPTNGSLSPTMNGPYLA